MIPRKPREGLCVVPRNASRLDKKQVNWMMITQHEFLKTAALTGVFPATMGCNQASVNTSAKKSNIILCMSDDQGWGDMGYYGHPVLKTPNFDDMTAKGLRFDHFYAAAPVCSPTRGSVMTGRHPNRFGCFKWGNTLRPRETTIAEALKRAGYVTGHFGKWHLGSVRQGSPVHPGACGFDEWFSAPNFYDNDPILSREGVAIQTQGESSMVTVDAALEFIRKYASSQPFLAVVWFGSPHQPHQAMPKELALYSGQSEELQHFYGEITAMDRAVGKLREELRVLGIHENTILWYCSDNGGLRELGVTGGRAHKGSIYEGGLRVPAILEWPSRLPKHRMTDMPCSTSDSYPTLLEIANVTVGNQPPLDGISLLPLLDGKMDTRPKPMGFWDYPIGGIGVPSHQLMLELLEAQKTGEQLEPARLSLDAGKIDRQYPEDKFPGHAAWLNWPWKLHRKEGKDNQLDVDFELYNLDEDPNEQNNQVHQYPELVTSMREALKDWLASVVRSLNGSDYC